MKISHFKRVVQAVAILAALCIVSVRARRGGVGARVASVVLQAQEQVQPAAVQQPVVTVTSVPAATTGATTVQPVTVGRRGVPAVAAPVVNQIAAEVSPARGIVSARGAQVVSSVVNPVQDTSQDQAAALQQQMASQIQAAQAAQTAAAPEVKVVGRGASSRGPAPVLGGVSASDVTTAQKAVVTKSVTAPVQDTSQAQAAALQQQMASQIQQAQAAAPEVKVVGRGASGRGPAPVLGGAPASAVSTAQSTVTAAPAVTDSSQAQAAALQQQMASKIAVVGRGAAGRGAPVAVVVSQPTTGTPVATESAVRTTQPATTSVVAETPTVTVQSVTPAAVVTPSRPGSRGLPQAISKPVVKITSADAVQEQAQQFTIDLNKLSPIYRKTKGTIAEILAAIQKKSENNKYGHFITQAGKGLGSTGKDYLDRHKGTLVPLKQGTAIGKVTPEIKKEYEKILKYVDVADLVNATGEPFPDPSVKMLYLNDPSASAVATAATGVKFTGATAMQAAQGIARGRGR